MFQISYDGISRTFQDIERYTVYAAEPPWRSCSKLFAHPPTSVTIVKNLERETLDDYAKACPETDYVVGIGGGTAIDASKYVAQNKLGKKSKLVLIPTIVSVNAFLSPEIAVRINGVVHYQGPVFADLVLIDTPIIRAAPIGLNRAGVGDIYSARTSLADWKIEQDQFGGWFDEEVYGRTAKVLKLIQEKAWRYS